MWLVVGLAGAVGLVALLGVRAIRGTWTRLERAEAALGVPAGFELLDRRREGTDVCVISCDEARIRLVFRSTAPIESACARSMAAAERVSDDLGGGLTSETTCAAWGALDGAGEDASVGLSLGSAATVAADEYEVDWVRELGRRQAEDDLLLVVVLNSGID